MAIKQIFNTSAELDYPTVLPTLDLDFANSKTLDPRITFTRSSGESYVGADGLIKLAGVNEPRFDHDPYTGESLGLLIEESRTNLITRSENLTFWSQPNSTVTETTEVPSIGNRNPYKIVLNNNTSGYYSGIYREFGVTTPSYYTFSFFVKYGNLSTLFFRESYSFGGGFSVNLLTKKVTSIGGYCISAGIQEYPNGWCRVYGTWDFTSTTGGRYTVWDLRVAGIKGDYCYAWGAQLEAGAFPTSYIPTVASTRTRAADVAQITGTNFSSWFNPSVGTFFTDSTNDNLTSNISSSSYNTKNTVAFSLGSGSARVYTPILSYLTNNTIMCNLFSYNGYGTEFGPNLQNTLSKTADVSKVCVYSDILNNLYAISTAGQINVISRPSDVSITGQLAYTLAQFMVIGYNSNYYGNYIGRIKRITYYPKRLTNQQLQTLTT
jgi:hypothetical protein